MQRTPHPTPVKAGLEKVGIYGTRWAMGALGLGLLWLLAAHGGKVPAPSEPPPVDGALPLQQWSVDTAPRLLVSLLQGTLPKPDPRQRKPPCDPDLEREFDGYCWVALRAMPPCPKGKAWERDGGCYAFALPPARVPSSGEPHPSNVAGEP